MSPRPRHGALRPSVIWGLVLVAAVALIAWQLQHPVAPTVDADEQPGAPLVSAAYGDWAAVEFVHRGERQRLERDAAGQWFRHDAVAGETAGHAHRADPAAAERIATVLATFSRARIERTLASTPARLAGWGLANPALIVLIHGRDGRMLQTLELGDLAPDGLSRYLQLPQTQQVHTIPDYHASALLSLLAEPLPATGAAAATAGGASAAPAGAGASGPLSGP
jgi:hypothetical protein